MNVIQIDIFVGERYYHSLNIDLDNPKTKDGNGIKRFVEQQLPSLKKKKWRIKYE
jgi:hypothetical protein